MSLIQQQDKIVILSRRESSFTDQQSGEHKQFKYITGFNPVTSQVFIDLGIKEDNGIKFDDLVDYSVYDCDYVTKQSKQASNSVAFSAVRVLKRFGTLELKALK